MSEILIPGMVAPRFEGNDQDGNLITLENFKGVKQILYFYPRDLTPVCTVEACNLRDNYEKLNELGYKILGVSGDSISSHKKFQERHSLPFPLLADVDYVVSKLYGVYGEKKLFGKSYLGIIRRTFIINESGIIKRIIEKVTSKNHAHQILTLEGISSE